MNLLIAHPKKSFVEAVPQMLGNAFADHHLHYVHSLPEFIEKITLDTFDIILIDGDLADNNRQAFLSILATVKDESQTIVTVRETDRELAAAASQLGVHRVILKNSGYLLAITSALKAAFGGDAAAPKPPASAQPPVPKEPVTQELRVGEEGYFVCDRRGRFLSVSPSLESITRNSVDELLQLSITDLFNESQENTLLRQVFDAAVSKSNNSLTHHLMDKFGELHLVTIKVRVLRDEAHPDHIIGFRGDIHQVQEQVTVSEKQRFDQSRMISEFVNLVHDSYSEPLNVFLSRIIEITCQIFHFKRSTIALLDRRRQAFIKQALVGYSADDGHSVEQRSMEVPYEVIDRIFADRYRIKVLYYTQDQREFPHEDNPGVPERRAQRRRPLNEWHKRDLVLLNLKDRNGVTFGYISLDDPQLDMLPTRATFYNLELFSRLVSMSVENYYRFNTLAKKNRRLKQILANSNIYKLHLSLTDLLNETVWSAKYTLEFNLVTLLLIGKESEMLEVKSVACEDKIKLAQLRELTFDIHEFSDLLKDEYQTEHSFLINREEQVLKHYKQIYYGADANLRHADGWPNWAMLLVPIRGREGKIMGFLMADDPRDCRIPAPDTIHIMEILANQIAVAINNRIMYLEAKEANRKAIDESPTASFFDSPNPYFEKEDDLTKGGLKKLVERFLR